MFILWLLLIYRISYVFSSNHSDYTKCNDVSPNKKIVCHYRVDEYFRPYEINPCLCTHIIYSYVAIKDNFAFVAGKKGDLKSLSLLKHQNPRLKALVSVRPLNKFNFDQTTLFSNKISDFITKHNLDGIDIDWEYFSLNKTLESHIVFKDILLSFIKNLRKILNFKHILTLTTSRYPKELSEKYDFNNLQRYIDFFNLPAFDFDTEGKILKHPARLHAIADMENADTLIDLVLSSRIAHEKLILGVPAYGVLYRMKNVTQHFLGSKALQWDDNETLITHSKICSLRDSNWIIVREKDLTAPYMYYKDKWIGFEDEISLKLKVKYMILRNLGGIILWSVNDDDPTGSCGFSSFPLLQIINEMLIKPIDNINILKYNNTPSSFIAVIEKYGNVEKLENFQSNETFTCSEGYITHPEDCSKFYRCVEYGKEMIKFHYSCPNGLIFDQLYEMCNWPSWSPFCSGSGEIITHNKGFTCKSYGYFSDPQNCEYFYYCSDFGKGYFQGYEFKCPFDLGFDEEKMVCNWKWLVKGCNDKSGSTSIDDLYAKYSNILDPLYPLGSLLEKQRWKFDLELPFSSENEKFQDITKLSSSKSSTLNDQISRSDDSQTVFYFNKDNNHGKSRLSRRSFSRSLKNGFVSLIDTMGSSMKSVLTPIIRNRKDVFDTGQNPWFMNFYPLTTSHLIPFKPDIHEPMIAIPLMELDSEAYYRYAQRPKMQHNRFNQHGPYQQKDFHIFNNQNSRIRSQTKSNYIPKYKETYSLRLEDKNNNFEQFNRFKNSRDQEISLVSSYSNIAQQIQRRPDVNVKTRKQKTVGINQPYAKHKLNHETSGIFEIPKQSFIIGGYSNHRTNHIKYPTREIDKALHYKQTYPPQNNFLGRFNHHAKSSVLDEKYHSHSMPMELHKYPIKVIDGYDIDVKPIKISQLLTSSGLLNLKQATLAAKKHFGITNNKLINSTNSYENQQKYVKRNKNYIPNNENWEKEIKSERPSKTPVIYKPNNGFVPITTPAYVPQTSPLFRSYLEASGSNSDYQYYSQPFEDDTKTLNNYENLIHKSEREKPELVIVPDSHPQSATLKQIKTLANEHPHLFPNGLNLGKIKNSEQSINNYQSNEQPKFREFVYMVVENTNASENKENNPPELLSTTIKPQIWLNQQSTTKLMKQSDVNMFENLEYTDFTRSPLSTTPQSTRKNTSTNLINEFTFGQYNVPRSLYESIQKVISHHLSKVTTSTKPTQPTMEPLSATPSTVLSSIITNSNEYVNEMLNVKDRNNFSYNSTKNEELQLLKTPENFEFSNFYVSSKKSSLNTNRSNNNYEDTADTSDTTSLYYDSKYLKSEEINTTPKNFVYSGSRSTEQSFIESWNKEILPDNIGITKSNEMKRTEYQISLSSTTASPRFVPVSVTTINSHDEISPPIDAVNFESFDILRKKQTPNVKVYIMQDTTTKQPKPTPKVEVYVIEKNKQKSENFKIQELKGKMSTFDSQLKSHSDKRPKMKTSESKTEYSQQDFPDSRDFYTFVDTQNDKNKYSSAYIEHSISSFNQEISHITNFTEGIIPEVACTRSGLFSHPSDCNKFYECYWDSYIAKFTLHQFECPVKLAFDARIIGCAIPHDPSICVQY